jgi:hypothetical protein
MMLLELFTTARTEITVAPGAALLEACWERKAGEKHAASVNIKEASDQVEYEDHDPWIHAIWLAEMKTCCITLAMLHHSGDGEVRQSMTTVEVRRPS